MRVQMLIWLLTVSLCTHAGEPRNAPLDDYDELAATAIPDAPSADLADVAPDDRKAVQHGKYMVELLGCETCHTQGALEGVPDGSAALAGSDVGIAYTTLVRDPYPGVVFPPNITSDVATGIGAWSDEQLAAAIREGRGSHSGNAALIMPWPAFARLSDEDTAAIVLYLRNLKAVSHSVPDNVRPGTPTSEPFVYFGVYRTN